MFSARFECARFLTLQEKSLLILKLWMKCVGGEKRFVIVVGQLQICRIQTPLDAVQLGL
jgi:hypothetical protein